MAVVFLRNHHLHRTRAVLRHILPPRNLRPQTTRLEARQADQRNRQHRTAHRIRQPGPHTRHHTQNRHAAPLHPARHPAHPPGLGVLHGIPVRPDVSHAIHIPAPLDRAVPHERRHRESELHIHGRRLLPGHADHRAAERHAVPASQEAQQRRRQARVQGAHHGAGQSACACRSVLVWMECPG